MRIRIQGGDSQPMPAHSPSESSSDSAEDSFLNPLPPDTRFRISGVKFRNLRVKALLEPNVRGMSILPYSRTHKPLYQIRFLKNVLFSITLYITEVPS